MVSLDIHHTSLRTNGKAVEIIGNFPVHAERVEVFLGFIQQNRLSCLTALIASNQCGAE